MDIYEYKAELDMDDLVYEGGRMISSRGYEGGQFDPDVHVPNKKSRSLSSILCCGKSVNGDAKDNGGPVDWDKMSDAEKKDRIQHLWNKARRYNNKLRF
jgi:hypothetical protein